jgi:hypothetical protein
LIYHAIDSSYSKSFFNSTEIKFLELFNLERLWAPAKVWEQFAVQTHESEIENKNKNKSKVSIK